MGGGFCSGFPMQAARSPTPFGDGRYLCWAVHVQSQVCERQQTGDRRAAIRWLGTPEGGRLSEFCLGGP